VHCAVQTAETNDTPCVKQVETGALLSENTTVPFGLMGVNGFPPPS
jgi:hypothetical protein